MALKSHTVNKISTSKEWKLSLSRLSLTKISLLIPVVFLAACSSLDKQAAKPNATENEVVLNVSPATQIAPKEVPIEPAAPEKKRPKDFSQCGLDTKSRQLAEIIAKDSEQQRLIIQCDGQLALIAAEKAKEMALKGEVSHKGDYLGPNQRLLAFQYPLARSEHQLFNTVEAVMGGEEYPEDVWLSFQSSFPHKVHLLGEHPFYETQTQLGVGYYQKKQSPHVDYWVVYFANLEKK